MKKLRLWSIIFLVIAILVWIPWTIEIYGDMDPDVLIACGCVFGTAMAVSLVLSAIRVYMERKAKEKANEKHSA